MRFGQGQGRDAGRARQSELKDAKTKELKARFAKLGFGSVLIIDGAEVAGGVRPRRAQPARVDVLPVAGHQRLRHPAARELVLTKAAVEALEARFK